uniref:Uncharacterized protein n=1 Tax=Anguilla anguilla TaxID=7936 RepID=A0A0E9XQG0_ANGAN
MSQEIGVTTGQLHMIPRLAEGGSLLKRLFQSRPAETSF